MLRASFRNSLKSILTVFFIFLPLLSKVNAQGTIVTPLDVNKIVDKLIESYAEVQNFKCTLDKFEKVGAKTDFRTYNYYFMKPRLIRMEVIKGKNRGAIAVYRDGRVRACRAGLPFKPFIITCSLTSKTVTSLRGGTILESDWQNIVDKLKQYRKNDKLKLVGIENKEGRNTYVIEVEGIDEKGVTRRRLWIDVLTYLPLRTEMYEGEVLVNSMAYSDIAVNVEMHKELFNL